MPSAKWILTVAAVSVITTAVVFRVSAVRTIVVAQ